MHKGAFFTFLGMAIVGMAWGQMKKQFTVEGSRACENINLHLKANAGDCFIKAGQNSEILDVYSNHDQSSYSHQYRKEIIDRTCEVYLNFEDANSQGFGQTISTRVFGDNNAPVNTKTWNMYLSDSKPYNLILDYGIGNAHVDLSGLAIKKLKINTGSADVNLGYSTLENKVDMDTLSVKVDLGSINVKNLNFSRARYMVADVGFGNMTLDFSATPLVSNKIVGSVGAGSLLIILPSMQTPILVKINDSWLCSIKIPESMKKISENTFANAAYTQGKKTMLVFNLDVSMGSIIFKESGKF